MARKHAEYINGEWVLRDYTVEEEAAADAAEAEFLAQQEIYNSRPEQIKRELEALDVKLSRGEEAGVTPESDIYLYRKFKLPKNRLRRELAILEGREPEPELSEV